MAIFSVSDIVIAVTLIMNALALISSKLPSNLSSVDQGAASQYHRVATVENDSDGHGDLINSIAIDHTHSDDYCGASTIAEQLMNPTTVSYIPTSPGSGGPIVTRLRSLVYGMRKYSCVIVVWNIFFMVLMVFVFSS